MLEAGTRLIKRSINIDITSVGFCSEELIDRIIELPGMGKVLEGAKESEDTRFLTNIYLFRKYIEEYLNNHEDIDKGRDLLVRNLAPTESGLPIEVYCFARFETWEAYEKIQSEMFDHIYGIIPGFELRLYQRPGAYDVRCGNNKGLD
jgi:miniconductance mechanosensitive channel